MARTSAEDTQQRQIVVSLDGDRQGELLYGDTLTLEAPPGPHRLRVDNTWKWTTVEVPLAPGEHAKFMVSSRAGSLAWFLLSMLGAGPMSIHLERED